MTGADRHRGCDPAGDRGLQAERTRFAWRRTVLAASIVALLAARLALVRQAPLSAAFAIGLWLTIVVLGHHRVRTMSTIPARPPGPTMPVLALTIGGYSVLGAVLVLASHP